MDVFLKLLTFFVQGAPNLNPFGGGEEVAAGTTESEDGGLLEAALPALVIYFFGLN
jgi:hypothetical protein